MAEQPYLKWKSYLELTRLNRPIGIWLLLSPTLWALWLSQRGMPSINLLLIFISGTILMRSAGCIINDVCDQSLDQAVKRTKMRPLVTQALSKREALMLFFILSLLAFLLVLRCNKLTIFLSLIGAILTAVYPLLKRITHLPQLGLGIAFSWGVLMAFAAVLNTLPPLAFLVFITALIWPLIYDTQYAMVDRDDDIQIGIKSTAILFSRHDKKIIALLQMVFILFLLQIAYCFELKPIFYLSVFSTLLLFLYQQYLIKDRLPHLCFRAFLNNQWVGCILFLGIILSYI